MPEFSNEVLQAAKKLLFQATLSARRQEQINALQQEVEILRDDLNFAKSEIARLRPEQSPPLLGVRPFPDDLAHRLARVREQVVSMLVSDARHGIPGSFVQWVKRSMLIQAKADQLSAFDRAMLAKLCGREDIADRYGAGTLSAHNIHMWLEYELANTSTE